MSDNKVILEQLFKEILNIKTGDTFKNNSQSIKQDSFTDLITNIFDTFKQESTRYSNTSSATSGTQSSKEYVPSIEELLQHYSPLLCETFFHKVKKTKYVLLEIVNVNSSDPNKFPVSVIYYDKQLKTKWCRPLVEFHNNFKIVM